MTKKIKKIIKKKLKTGREPNEIKQIIKKEYGFRLGSYYNFISINSIIISYKRFMIKTNQKKINYMNLSFLNMIYYYLKKNCGIKKINKDFILKINEIIKILSINENEFVLWTLLIDEFIINNSNEWDLKDLFYLALISKEKTNKNFSELINNYKIYNNDFDEWYNRNISIVEIEIQLSLFNEQYKKLTKKNCQKFKYFDFNYFINYICSQKRKSKRKRKNIKLKYYTKYESNKKDNNLKETIKGENNNDNKSNDNINNNVDNININENYFELFNINSNNTDSDNRIKSNEEIIKNELDIRENNLSPSNSFFVNNISKESFNDIYNDKNLFNSIFFDNNEEIDIFRGIFNLGEYNILLDKKT